jgi:hypothetical protein
MAGLSKVRVGLAVRGGEGSDGSFRLKVEKANSFDSPLRES